MSKEQLANISSLVNPQYIKEFPDTGGNDTLLLSEILIRTIILVFDYEAR